MPYCENCGHPVNPTAKFCGTCGAPRQPPPQPASTNPSYPPPPTAAFQMSPAQQEQVLSCIIMSRDKRFGGTDYFTAVLTTQQIVFVPMTKDMVKQVTEINKQEAKGKVPRVNIYPYQQGYFATAPASLIAVGSLVVQNSGIQQISIRQVSVPGDEFGYMQEYEVQIASQVGTQTFKMSLREENIAKLMQVYP